MKDQLTRERQQIACSLIRRLFHVLLFCKAGAVRVCLARDHGPTNVVCAFFLLYFRDLGVTGLNVGELISGH